VYKKLQGAEHFLPPKARVADITCPSENKELVTQVDCYFQMAIIYCRVQLLSLRGSLLLYLEKSASLWVLHRCLHCLCQAALAMLVDIHTPEL